MAISLETIKEAYSLKPNLRTIFIRTNDRWAFLDGYRFLGIAWVIVGHCIFLLQFQHGMPWWRETIENMPVYLQFLANGDVAIDAFFVISAFLMANLLMKQYQENQRIKAGIFYVSRLMRLSPAYFLAIGCYLLVQPTAWEEKTVWLNFLYLQNFIQDYDRIFMYFTWSLAVEEQFYIFLPPFLIFVFFRSKRPSYWLLGIFLSSFLVRAWFVLTDEIAPVTPWKEIIFDKNLFQYYFVTIYDNLYTRYGAFICGIYVAYLYRFHSGATQAFLKTKTARWLSHTIVVIAAFLVFFPILYKDIHLSYEVNLAWQIIRRNIASIAVAWFILCGLYSVGILRRFNGFMSLRIFYPFGHLLYSMYLFHYLAVGFVMLNLQANLDYFNLDIRDYFAGWILLAFVISLFGTMLMAIISFLLVELPVMNLRPK